MPHTQRSLVLRYLRRVFGTAASGDVTDADLLRRFVTGRDEAAFELLLWRHGTMVLSVCRDVTHDEHTAEDAFQATFFALVRKAAAIRDGQSVGAWLYQVAYRVALRARSQVVRRAARERHDLDLPNRAATAELPDETVLRELRPLVHEEVQRLPPKYRLPIVLCYLEGLTYDEAARQLGWPKGTVAGRLSRARDLLRKRLSRRGVTLSVALAALALSPAPASASVSAALVQTTLRAGLLIATGKAVAETMPPQVAALTQGVLQAMFWNKVKLTAAVVLAVGLVSGGVGLLASGQLSAQPPAQETAAGAGQDRAAGEPKPDDAQPAQKGGTKAAGLKALAAARKQSIRNLEQIALAMHNYLDTFGSFPPPAIYSKEGKPLLSWRVALLPYLDQGTLYRQFHLDEPWDSPHNKKLLAKRPKVYHIPGSEDRTSTYYQVFVGEDTIFERRRRAGEGGGLSGAAGSAATPRTGGAGGGGPAAGAVAGGPAGIRLADIPDGTSNTILVIEAGWPVPWTKPEDLAYAATGRIPPLGGAFPDAIYTAFADGKVYALKRKYDEQTLRLAITRNDGQNFDLGTLIDPAPGIDSVQLKEDNERLRREVDEARVEVRRLQQQLLDQRLAVPGQGKEDTVTERLKEERRLLEQELDRTREEARRLQDRIQRVKRGESEVETKKK
jgi:RNA polymerase sigma factor (sigma-70 family)